MLPDLNKQLSLLSANNGDILALDLNRFAHTRWTDSSAAGANQLESKRIPRVSGRIAVIPLYGVVTQHGGWYSQSMDRTYRVMAAAVENPEIGALVLDIDSPGGTAYGCMEFSDKIRELTEQKPIVAISNSLAASAAYWIGCGASHFVATPSGDVGSIGVYRMHVEYHRGLNEAGIDVDIIRAGAYKIEANPFEPLSPEGRERAQAEVDETYSDFIACVAKMRGVTKSKVLSDFGEGRVFNARKAAELGMIDKICEYDELLLKMMGKYNARKDGKSADNELSEWIRGEAGVESKGCKPPTEASKAKRRLQFERR